jgi:hypothetical protein
MQAVVVAAKGRCVTVMGVLEKAKSQPTWSG